MNRDFIFNYIYPHVVEVIHRTNNPVYKSPCKFIIKGGASVKYHFDMHGISSAGLTSDIDIAPLFLPQEGHTYASDPTYIQNAIQYNMALYESIIRKLTHQSRIDHMNIYFNMKFHNGLVTMQIKINDSDYYDMIDLSYINSNDEDSTFMKAILITHGSLENFVTTFNGDFSDVDIELQVATFGYELYFSHVNSIDHWKELLEFFRNEARIYKSRIELFGDDEDDVRSLELAQRAIEGYERQLSDEYIEKLNDKLLRFQRKISGLEIIKLGLY